MATSFNGSLGQTNNYSSINELITKWPTAAQNQGIQLSGIAFDGGVTDYLDPTVISNLTFATNAPQSFLSYGSINGIGVPSSYSGWFTEVTKNRAEINHDPNTNQSQVLKVKWADNQDITSATIGLSGLLPKTSPGDGDQGNEVGVLQLFKDGAPVSASNFTITRLNPPNPPNPQKPIGVSSAVTFIGDRIDGTFTFQIVGNPLTGVTFDELRFSAQSYDSPTVDYATSSFKSDGSDYLVRNIEYQGISVAPTSPSLFQFQQPNYTVPEGGVATINVTRTGGTGVASINYATVDGTASSAGTAPDYATAAGVLNFAAGQTTASFTVTALTDLILESPETVSLVLSGGNASTNPSILTINDVAPTPTPTPPSSSLFQFQQANYTVPEGGVATINVTRTGGTGAASSINYATVDATASSTGSAPDYTTAAGTLTFGAGQTTASFTVTALSDLILESPETVSLVLSGGNVGSNPSFLTILDVPPTPTPTPTSPSLFQFAQPNYTVAEGGVATINVTRTGGTGAASINYATLDGTASSAGTAADYTAAAGALSFAAGQTTASFTVTALTDLNVESPETVNLVLLGGNVGSTPSLLTINDVPPTGGTTPPPTSTSLFEFAQPNYTVAEGGVATINVTRTGGTGAAAINYQTLDGSASSAGTAGDYTPAAGLLNFAAGQTTASFTVTALTDSILESPETVNLVLLGGNVGSTPSKLTINDVPPTGTVPGGTTPGGTTPMSGGNTYFFGAANYSVTEGSAASITINRSGNLSVPGTITFLTSGGSAKSTDPGKDYSSVFLTVNFAAGQTSAQVPVPTLTDPLTEPTETVGLFLSGGTLGSPSLAVLSILDATPVTPTSFFYGPSPDPITDGGTGVVTINRTGNTSVSESVNYLILPPASIATDPIYPEDYNITPFSPTNSNGGQVTFAAGVTSVSLTISNVLSNTSGQVTLGFGPGANIGFPPNSQITLI